MKFARSFEKALHEDEFPSQWIKAAIAYRQLKKCIKDVQRELLAIGLRPDDLRDSQYILTGMLSKIKVKVNPKLVFQIATPSAVPLSASLSSPTRQYLESLAPKVEKSRPLVPDNSSDLDTTCARSEHSTKFPFLDSSRVVEIHLTTDSRFFRLLTLGLSGLNTLQTEEESKLLEATVTLGETVAQAAEPRQSILGRSDLYTWRDIFSLYTESEIFFSISECKEHDNDTRAVQTRLQDFSMKLIRLAQQFKREESRIALQGFLDLNMKLLLNLKFQELNVKAMTKILKKFDKRTALGARETFPSLVAADGFSSPKFAKSVCFQISEKLLRAVPQICDYLCPVCFNISFKPIRLRCNHIFCIRCLVVMQRMKQNHCPLCRGAVVMEADSRNLDTTMVEFLGRYFPREVKAKQKQHEYEAGLDKYGEAYEQKCLMI